MSLKQSLQKLVEPFGQLHLLAFWDRLAPPQRESLARQIEEIDFARLAQLLAGTHASEDWAALARRAVGPPAIRLGASADRLPHSREQARHRGAELLRANEIGVILVAGGQGTRLGFDHPKGMYSIGPVSGASLFQILFEKLLAVRRRHACLAPLYLMTSPATHDETCDYLARRENFGLPAEDTIVFCQGTMPAVEAESGRVLLASPGGIALGPDGHGGLLAALRHSGALGDMHRRGVRYLFYLQVDNPLATMCDEEFLGFHALCESELSTQAVAKRTPADRVGNVVSVDGVVRIVEYSDLPAEAGERRRADGSLELWAGNIAVHAFDVDLLERWSGAEKSLPFHLARKKVPYVDALGNIVEPAEPNAIKFEQFIFDLLPESRRSIVVEVEEARAFAPLKNGPGADRDSPEIVKAMMSALHASWLREAGARVAETATVEISPLWALDAADVARRAGPDLNIQSPTYLSPF